MKNVIISPHTDDALFSMCDLIAEMKAQKEQVTIVSVFAEIPNEPVGRRKHSILRWEHTLACKIMGVEEINGPYLDDVYQNSRSLKDMDIWLKHVTRDADRIYIPLGIHHPDHIYVRNLFINNHLNFHFFYEELPYRMIYPKVAEDMWGRYVNNELGAITLQTSDKKKKVVQCYQSQLENDWIREKLFVQERIWKR